MKKTLLFGLLLASAAAFAHPGSNYGPGNDMRMLFGTLDLTAKQQEQLNTIRKEARNERRKLTDQLDDLRDKTRQRVMAVLTDEQKKTLLAERKAMMQKRMQQNDRCDQMPNRAKMPMQMQNP